MKGKIKVVLNRKVVSRTLLKSDRMMELMVRAAKGLGGEITDQYVGYDRCHLNVRKDKA